jgi:hypothetical protein
MMQSRQKDAPPGFTEIFFLKEHWTVRHRLDPLDGGMRLSRRTLSSTPL